MIHPKPNRRKAFTLLEILVVVGIIVILATLTVVGLKTLNPAAKVTRSQLENARSLIAGYEAAGGSLKALPSGQLGAVGDVKSDGGDRDGDKIADCWDADDPNFPIVRITNIAMNQLLAVPANKVAFERLGARLVVTLPKEGPYPSAPGSAVLRRALVDGWGNPIYFVPAEGIKSKLANGSVVTIRSPDGRPFFVSAGPDGILGAAPGSDGQMNTADDVPGGDDDMYSFQQ